MKLSQERILTTHVGSLPRPSDLTQLLALEDQGGAVDQSELQACVANAVTETVASQVELGIDVVDIKYRQAAARPCLVPRAEVKKALAGMKAGKTRLLAAEFQLEPQPPIKGTAACHVRHEQRDGTDLTYRHGAILRRRFVRGKRCFRCRVAGALAARSGMVDSVQPNHRSWVSWRK